MAPQLGVLSTVHEEAATQVFERDCLIRLGAVVAPIGSGKPGQACLAIELEAPGQQKMERKVPFGELVLLPLPLPEAGTARLKVTPERGFDLGPGKGQVLSAEIHGGVVGLIVDTRGRRPFHLPADATQRIDRLRAWNQALDLYGRQV
jgi:hypothetical protein